MLSEPLPRKRHSYVFLLVGSSCRTARISSGIRVARSAATSAGAVRLGVDPGPFRRCAPALCHVILTVTEEPEAMKLKPISGPPARPPKQQRMPAGPDGS